MSLTSREQVEQFLTEMKVGSLLMKRTHSGEQYPRHYFLHQQEYYVSYHSSGKVFTWPSRCK